MLGAAYKTALSGMQAAEFAIGVTANNLANAMTDGFKASRVLFSDQTPQSGAAGQVGRGVRVAAVDQDFSQGTISLSGDPLDLALEGDGFFALQGADGERVFSRSGHFSFNADGELINESGLKVLGYNVDQNFQIDGANLEPLKPPSGLAGNGASLTSISVGEDGVLRGNYTDGAIRDLGQLGVATFANPNGLIARGGTTFAPGSNSGLPDYATAGATRFRSGAVELSNTDIATELVNLTKYSTMYRANAAVLSTESMYDDLFNMQRRY